MNVSWGPPPQQPVLRRGEAHVWFCDFSGITDLSATRRVLSESELGRANRFRSEEAGLTFLGAHLFLRSVLAAYLQIPASEVIFGTEANEKPCLDRSIHPTDIAFNLSHSHRSAACAVTRDAPVGIDIERPDPELCEVQTAEQVFSAQELHVLSKFEPGERSAAFFRGWTKKEAYAKCKGAGLTTELKSIETGFAIGSSRLGTLSLLTFECPNKNVATLAIAGVLDKIALWVLPAEKLIAS